MKMFKQLAGYPRAKGRSLSVFCAEAIDTTLVGTQCRAAKRECPAEGFHGGSHKAAKAIQNVRSLRIVCPLVVNGIRGTQLSECWRLQFARIAITLCFQRRDRRRLHQTSASSRLSPQPCRDGAEFSVDQC